MNKKNIITIAGRPGSGKSSTAKIVAQQLDYTHFSSGGLFRALAGERGIELLDANLSSEQNKEIDHLVDTKLQELGSSGDKLVIDSRTAWHWIPASFKVFLDLDLSIAAERILQNLDHGRTTSEKIHADVQEYAKLLKQRLDSESRRYKALYNIDPYRDENYDLIVNTETNDLATVVKIILQNYRTWLPLDTVAS